MFDRGRPSILSIFVLAGVVLGAGTSSDGRSRGDESGQVEVNVVSTTGEPIVAERYVAVVPVAAPWAEPAAEAIAAPDEAMPVFTLAEGSYRVFCSALGFSFSFGGVQRTVEVEAGSTVETSCELPPVVAHEGRVVSVVDRSPVVGARVGPAGFFAPCHVRSLSPLGSAHVLGQHVVTTDERGGFVLPMPAGSIVPLWVEARGFTPAYLPSFGPAASGELPPVLLEPGGGSLEVTLSFPEGFPHSQYRLFLTAAKGWGDGRAPRLPAYLLHLPCSGEGVLQWTSLPADVYRVWLKGPAAGDHDLLPIEVGSVEVRDGLETRFEQVVQAPVEDHAGRAAHGPLVRLLLHDERVEEWPSARVVHWDGRGVRFPAASARQVSGGVLVQVGEACSAGDRFVASSPTRVSAPLEASALSCEVAAGLLEGKAAQAVEVRGRLIPPEGGSMPLTCLVHLATSTTRSHHVPALLGTFPAAVAADGRWSARVPAGEHDLVLASGSYAAYQVATAVLRPMPALNDLGVQQLVPGAALLARVIDGACGLPLAGALVEVFPQEAARAVATDVFGGRQRPSIFSASTNGDGWVRFPDLVQGRVFLRVSGPWPTPWLSQEIVLREEREVVLDPVEALPPGSLDVSVDAEDPDVFDRLGELELNARCGRGCGPLSATSGRYEMKEGMFELPNLQPGTWMLRLWAAEDGRLNQLGNQVEVQVEPGQAHHVTLPVEGRIFDARVTFRGEPVTGARVNVYPWLWSDRVLPRLVTDEEGMFSVFLDEPGMCNLEVVPAGEAVGGQLPAVEFEDPERTVEIRMPEGRLEGTVVDTRGEPVERALVEAHAESWSAGMSPSLRRRTLLAKTFTGREGSFVLDRLAAGSWSVEAREGSRRSETRVVVLSPDQTRTGVHIVVDDQTAITGRFVSEAGAEVRGRAVLTIPPSRPGEPAVLRRVEIEPDGRFALPLTARQAELVGRQPVNLVAGGDAAVLTAQRRTLSDRCEIVVPGVGATVQLEVAGGAMEDILDGLALVDSGGAYFTLRTALNCGNLDAGESPGEGRASRRLVIQNLAPGRWRLVAVVTPADRHVLAAANGLALPVLAAFSAVAGGTASADVRPPWL